MRDALLFAGVAVGCGRSGSDRVAPDAPSCVMPATSDAFASGASPCGAWGVATAMEDSVRDAGLHVIVPPGHDGYTATCTDGSLPFDAGTFVSISAVTTLASGFSQLAVSTTGGSLARLDYFVDLGTLELAD